MSRPGTADLAPALLAWWTRHGRRDLPWQQNPTPYRVWISEAMLQQTQVATVIPYYERFIAALPAVTHLAAAPVDRVLHLWSGLGYYARARNLHRAAQLVVDRHGGVLPQDFETLQGLPGIGRSTAGAILALAANRRYPILDGNAKRVLARYFGVPGWPGQAAVARELWSLATDCTPADHPARYTQAIMDLGATLCRRGQPDCARCPLATDCAALRAGRTLEIPGRRPRRERPRRETVALLIRREDGTVLLERRPAEGIWGGLWGLPETRDPGEVADWCERRLGCAPCRIEQRPVLTHGFTHFDLEIRPVLVQLDAAPRHVMEGDGWLWYNRNRPAQVGLAAPVSRLLATIGDGC